MPAVQRNAEEGREEEPREHGDRLGSALGALVQMAHNGGQLRAPAIRAVLLQPAPRVRLERLGQGNVARCATTAGQRQDQHRG